MDIKEFIVGIMESGMDLESDAQIVVKNDEDEIEADNIEISVEQHITRNIPTFTISLDRYSVVNTSDYEELKEKSEEVDELKARIEELEKELEQANDELEESR